MAFLLAPRSLLSRSLVAIALCLCSVEVAAAQSGNHLDLAVSCPVGANDPEPPHNPQLTSCGNDQVVNGRCQCKIYWANQGGPLSNLVFTIAGGQLPAHPYYDVAKDPDGNLAFLTGYAGLPTSWPGGENTLGIISADGHTIIRGAIGNVTPNYGTINGYAYGYHQLLDPLLGYSGMTVSRTAIDPGTTGELTFEIAPPYAYGAAPEAGAIAISVTADGVSVAAPQIVYVDSLAQTKGPPVTPIWTPGLVGGPIKADGYVEVSDRGPQTNLEEWIYLPYDNGGAIVSDGNYDPGNPAHHIVVDTAHLTAQGLIFISGNSPSYSVTLDATLSPDLAAPDTGFNANKVLWLEPATNKLFLRTGFMPSWTYATLRYQAPLTAAYAWLATPGRAIPEQRCGKSDQHPQINCGTTDFVFVQLPNWSDRWFWYVHLDSHDDGGWSQWAMGEDGALRADRKLRGELGASLQDVATLTDLTDVNFIYQVGGSSDGPFGDTTIGRDVALSRIAVDGASSRTMWHNPHAIYVTNVAGDYGSEGDITQRVLPAADDPSWVLCDESDGTAPAACDDAALAAASPGFTMADVTHVRVELPFVAQTASTGAPENTLYFDWTGVATADARSSIDGSSPSTNDMTRASIGAVMAASFTAGTAMYAGALGRTIEVDPRPRVGFSQIGNGYWDSQLDGATFEAGSTSLNQPLEVGCTITESKEGAVHSPWHVDIALPQGFTPDGDITQAIAVTPRPGPDAAPSYTSEWDAPIRTYHVTINAPDPVYGSEHVPPQTLSGYYVRAAGRFVQGAPAHSVDTCHTLLSYDDSDGNLQTRDWTTHIGHSLTNVFPALRIDGATDRLVVERHGHFDLATRLQDEVFSDATGLPLPAGATAAAHEVAVYYRVNRDGDYDDAIEHGHIAVAMTSADAQDDGEIYVSVAETPTRTSRTGLNAGNGWTWCSTNPDPCDADALDAAGIADPASVRWIVFAYPFVDMTDAAPRSQNPGPGLGHTNVPYVGTVHLLDTGSTGIEDDKPVVRAFLEVRSADTASPSNAVDVDVEVDTDCDAGIHGVGFDQPEICDGLDNDCDGDTNEGLTRTVACDGLCPASGEETCDASGNWVGEACAGSVSCDDGKDCTSDACVGGVCTHPATVAALCDDGVNCTENDRCNSQGDCAGTAIVCTSSEGCEVARCDEASGECVSGENTCSPLTFYGVVNTPTGLGSIRCQVDLVAPTHPVTCDMAGGKLVVGPPMCGGGSDK